MTTVPVTTAPPAAGPVDPPKIIGVREMILGSTGCGKTHAIRTLVEAGLEVFVIFTEPGMEVLADVPSDKLHWHYIPPSNPDWADMMDSANKINSLSLKALSDMSDINKSKYREFWNLLKALSDFPCDRTGIKFGDVAKWGNDRALVIDSLSGLNIMAMNLVTGSKPVKSMADWGMAIDNLERLLTKVCTGTECHFVLTAHLERETDEVTGGTSMTAATLGRKLGPRLPRFFSDVIQARREGAKFLWATDSVGVDLKARNLPIAGNLAPSFVPIIKKWRQQYNLPDVQAG